MNLPLSSLIIIFFLLILVVFVGLWKALNRKKLLKNSIGSRKNGQPKPQSSSVNIMTKTPDAHYTASANEASAEIDETSILDEIEIYLSYGHLEQAVTSLSWYVSHNLGDTVQARRLLGLYLEISDLDHFTELLESMFESGVVVSTEAQNFVLAGLQKDSQNLQLRVLAENIGINNTQLAAITSAKLAETTKAPSPTLIMAQKELQQALVNPEPLDLDLSGFSEKLLPKAVKKTGEETVLDSPGILLSGSEPMDSISAKEYTISATLTSPMIAVQALLATHQIQDAERLLRRSLVFDARKLVLHTALLDIYYRQKRKDNYAEALLQLYINLWGAGTDLRTRLLKHGRQLGEHLLWNQLEASEDQKNILAYQADKYGLYLPLSAIPFSSPALIIEEFRRNHQITPKDSDDSVIEEFDSLLEYGQVEEAVDLLEKAILARPEHKIYYRPLLEMYERMGAHERFSQFTKIILGLDTPPDEDIMRQMFSLAERMQRQPQRQVS